VIHLSPPNRDPCVTISSVWVHKWVWMLAYLTLVSLLFLVISISIFIFKYYFYTSFFNDVLKLMIYKCLYMAISWDYQGLFENLLVFFVHCIGPYVVEWWLCCVGLFIKIISKCCQLNYFTLSSRVHNNYVLLLSSSLLSFNIYLVQWSNI